MNILKQGDKELVSVDYSDLLEKIFTILRHQQTKNPFSISSDRCRLLIDIDTIATQVASESVQNPLGSSDRSARTATVNFSRGFKESFPSQVRDLRDCLRQRLESLLGQNTSVEEFAASLVIDLQTFSGSVKGLGFTYDFGKQHKNLQKQKLSLDSDGSSSNSILQLHKLTITVQNTDKFEADLKEGLEKHLNRFDIPEREQEELKDILEGQVVDELSDFQQLKRVVDTESLGKLKKEAKITYLEYLLDNIHSLPGTPDPVAVIYLEDLIRRLRLIEEYISNVESQRADSDYEVNYAGIQVNYKDLFSRSEVLDALPIIPIVAGNLGETTDNNGGERTFIFGIKLKLGGPVQSLGGCLSFDYYLNLLNPDQHQDELTKNPFFAEKVLKLAFLYYFVFATSSNPLALDYNPNSELQYDPISVFEARVLPILRGSDEAAKKNLFCKIKQGFEHFNVSLKISRLRKLLKNFLGGKTILPTQTYTRHIGVRRGILEWDTNNITTGIFFNEVLLRNSKESLRYISINQSSMDGTALCQLPIRITLEDIRYFPTEGSQKFSMEYDIQGINTLPVLWVPRDEKSMQVYKYYFLQNKLLLFPYNNRRLDSNGLDSTEAFVYRFTFSLLAYICLRILLDGQKNSFIPMLRLHQGDHNNPSLSEKFTAALSRVLSHLLKEKHRSSSQGFRIQQEPKVFNVRNGLSSLYSMLPKKFRFTPAAVPKLEKLAVIVVSSRESDATRSQKNRSNRIANLMGEVVSVRCLEDGKVQIETLKAFSDNYHIIPNPLCLDYLYEYGNPYLKEIWSTCRSSL